MNSPSEDDLDIIRAESEGMILPETLFSLGTIIAENRDIDHEDREYVADFYRFRS